MKPDQERLSEQAAAFLELHGALDQARSVRSLARQLTEAERENGRLTKELRGACEVIAAASIEQGGRLWISESSLLKVGAKTDLIREEDPREPGLIYRALNTGESQDSPPKDSSEALDTGGSEG